MKRKTQKEKVFLITPKEKRVMLILAAAVILLCLSVSAIQSKEFAFLLVKHDREDLTAMANAIAEAGEEDPDQSYYFCDIAYNPSINMVEFTASSWGIAPSGTKKGFYYSPQDIPLGYDYGEVSFLPHEAGWLWEEENGNNTIYTERIVENWFWFEFRW